MSDAKERAKDLARLSDSQALTDRIAHALVVRWDEDNRRGR